jgi:RNA polymerase sigma-70 factor (family 1)
LNTFSDIELWTLIKKDNSQALGELYDRHWEKMYATAYWHVYDQETAKDIVQDLFVQLWEKRNGININDTVEGYLKTSVRNRVFNHLRSLAVRKKHNGIIGKSLSDSNATITELSNEQELKRLYHSEIDKLPGKMKEVYLMSKEAGLTIEQIANRLTLSEQTVKNQITNAMKKIRTGLEHYRYIFLLGCVAIAQYIL